MSLDIFWLQRCPDKWKLANICCCCSHGRWWIHHADHKASTICPFVHSEKIDFFFDSLSVTAELIGPNHESGAFIYGFMSLVEKVTNGIIIIGVQSLASGRSSGNSTFYTQVLFYVCGGASLMGALAMLSLAPVKIGRRFWKSKSLSDKEERVEIPAIHITSESVTEDL